MNTGFVVIQGDAIRKVDPQEPFVKEFTIDGVDSGDSAILFLMVKGLTSGDPVEVAINGEPIGKLYPQGNLHSEGWYTHMLHYSASEGALNPNPKSKETKNSVEIPAKGTSTSFPKFYIQNLVCFYKEHKG